VLRLEEDRPVIMPPGTPAVAGKFARERREHPNVIKHKQARQAQSTSKVVSMIVPVVVCDPSIFFVVFGSGGWYALTEWLIAFHWCTFEFT